MAESSSSKDDTIPDQYRIESDKQSFEDAKMLQDDTLRSLIKVQQWYVELFGERNGNTIYRVGVVFAAGAYVGAACFAYWFAVAGIMMSTECLYDAFVAVHPDVDFRHPDANRDDVIRTWNHEAVMGFGMYGSFAYLRAFSVLIACESKSEAFLTTFTSFILGKDTLVLWFKVVYQHKGEYEDIDSCSTSAMTNTVLNIIVLFVDYIFTVRDYRFWVKRFRKVFSASPSLVQVVLQKEAEEAEMEAEEASAA